MAIKTDGAPKNGLSMQQAFCCNVLSLPLTTHSSSSCCSSSNCCGVAIPHGILNTKEILRPNNIPGRYENLINRVEKGAPSVSCRRQQSIRLLLLLQQQQQQQQQKTTVMKETDCCPSLTACCCRCCCSNRRSSSSSSVYQGFRGLGPPS